MATCPDDPEGRVARGDSGTFSFGAYVAFCAGIAPFGAPFTPESFSLRPQRQADLQLLATDTHFLQAPENFLGHITWQIDKAVIFPDHDAADVFAIESGFIRDRAHDIGGLHPVHFTHFNAIRLQCFIAALTRPLFVA